MAPPRCLSRRVAVSPCRRVVVCVCVCLLLSGSALGAAPAREGGRDKIGRRPLLTTWAPQHKRHVGAQLGQSRGSKKESINCRKGAGEGQSGARAGAYGRILAMNCAVRWKRAGDARCCTLPAHEACCALGLAGGSSRLCLPFFVPSSLPRRRR